MLHITLFKNISFTTELFVKGCYQLSTNTLGSDTTVHTIWSY